MNKTGFKKMVQDYDEESLAWWTPEQTEELNIQFKTIEAALNEGWLIYDGMDDLYIGKKTYKEKWSAIKNHG